VRGARHQRDDLLEVAGKGDTGGVTSGDVRGIAEERREQIGMRIDAGELPCQKGSSCDNGLLLVTRES